MIDGLESGEIELRKRNILRNLVVRRSLTFSTFITMVNDGIWIPNLIIFEFKTFNESSDIDAITLRN
ncbi:hypothetical protein [Candidatus Enterococcus palustris]|nr:hypothetical protein [Enterococcus sp. 7F3_DIV0205]